jgi:hypothetical protein
LKGTNLKQRVKDALKAEGIQPNYDNKTGAFVPVIPKAVLRVALQGWLVATLFTFSAAAEFAAAAQLSARKNRAPVRVCPDSGRCNEGNFHRNLGIPKRSPCPPC